MRRITLPLCLLFALAAQAADLPTSAPSPPSATPMQQARDAIQAKDWKGAEAHLREALKAEPRQADAWNLLGFSLRWQDRYDESLAAYAKVFEIDPKHLGGHEYIGRTYLKMGRKSEAQQHLAKLRALCAACEETRELAEAIAKAP